jgi:ABC-type nitrate/sulfonate/bicarbonate transport system substrate-binding protein
MKLNKILPIIFFSVVAGFVSVAAQAKEIVIGTSGTPLTNIPIWVGVEKKLFEPLGITVQYVMMRSDLAVKALITGDVDYIQSAPSVMRAAAAGAPMVAIFGAFNRTFFELVANPEIKTLQNIKGKVIGISRHGASTEYAVRFGLKANGIDPDKDVKFVALGEVTTARITALKSGVVVASVLQVPDNFAAHKIGAHTLLPLGDYLEVIGAGLGASRSKVEQNRDEVKRVIVGLVRSIDYMTSHRPEVIQIIQKKYGGMDKNMADYVYDLVSKYVTRNGLSSEKALQNAFLGTPYEGKATNLSKLVDFSVAREVAEGK